MTKPLKRDHRLQSSDVQQHDAAASRDTKRPSDSVPMTNGPFAALPATFGRYQVETLLGRGAMGSVFLALDTKLNRRVALKIPKVAASGSKRLLLRLETEAKAAAQLDHPCLCKVHDSGEIGGQCYIAMQYIEGETLKSQLESQPKTVKEAVSLILQLAEGLSEAHELGIVHRDLKPENIMINRRGTPVVLDFGLAKLPSINSNAFATQVGTILGSPAYMSPEQANGNLKEIDRRSDIYSLGIILFELLTGKLPFTGNSHQVMGQKSVSDPDSPLSVNPDLPPQLAAICHKMIAKSIVDRYQTLSDVVRDLQNMDSFVAQPAEIQPYSVDLEAYPLVFDESPVLVRNRKQKKRRAFESSLAVLFGGMAAGVILLFGIVLWFRSGDALVKIEVHADDVEVSFQERTIQLVDGTQNYQVRPGEHTLHIKSGTTEFDSDKFALKRGNNPSVTVELVSSEIIVKWGDQEIGRRQKPPTSPITPSRKPAVVQIDPEEAEGVPEPGKHELSGPEMLTDVSQTNLDRIATGKWIPLMDSKTVLPDPKTMKYQNGVLELDNGILMFPQVVGRDIVLRCAARRIHGANANLWIRESGSGKDEVGYVAVFNGQQLGRGGIGSWKNAVWTEIQGGPVNDQLHPDQFVNLAVSAIGDTIRLFINDVAVTSITNRDFKQGTIGVAAFKGKYEFMNLEYQILDSGSVQAPEGIQEVQVRPIESQSLTTATRTSAILKTEFVSDAPLTLASHGSTIVETQAGLVAAWYGGTHEKHPDVGIWVSRQIGGQWSSPIEIANGVQSATKRFPCWNPVLFQPHLIAGGQKSSQPLPLMLFFKIGPHPTSWWGMLTTSNDAGKTWSVPRRLPEGILGPTRNKPVQLANGDILCGTSSESDGCQVYFERSSDLGQTWKASMPVQGGKPISAIQPAFVVDPNGRLQAFVRTRMGNVYSTESLDGGIEWTPFSSTSLPNPNSGIDSLTLADKRALIVYNHSNRERSPLNVALSTDGKKWERSLILESDPGEFSYPAVIQTNDGLVHISYTWKRERIKHVVIDPKRISRAPMIELVPPKPSALVPTKPNDVISNRADVEKKVVPPLFQPESLIDINAGSQNASAWISPDGGRIYWEHFETNSSEPQIRQAERSNAGAPFGNARVIALGRQPTLTRDQLQIIYIRNAGPKNFKRLFTAIRRSISDRFDQEIELKQFGDHLTFNNPFISLDGLSLFVNARSDPELASTKYYVSRRSNVRAPWSKFDQTPIVWDAVAQKAPLTWLAMEPNELSFLATHELEVGQFRMIRFTRKTKKEPFQNYEYLSLPGLATIHGRTPRYVPATKELFFTAPSNYAKATTLAGWQDGHHPNLWVVRNVDVF